MVGPLSRRPSWVALWVTAFLFAGTPAAAQNAPAAVEIAPFAGALVTSSTFDDPDSPGGFTVKSTLAGADVVYYPRSRVGVGLLAIRRAVVVGRAAERTALSAALIGGLMKYRRPLGERSHLAVLGGAGVSTNALTTGEADTRSTSRTTGLFAMTGATVSVTMTHHVSFDIGVRHVLNRFRTDDDAGATHAGGVVIVAGIALWTR